QLEVCLQASYLDQFCLVNEFLSLAFLLNQSDEGLTDFRAVGLRFLHLVACAEVLLFFSI
ncbi:hypothetical protein, partial [Hallella colorans]|uniref:hypothetical protein n=1 Tax=Hallella colorans TaxID=1703337 RepID=UPI00288B690F